MLCLAAPPSRVGYLEAARQRIKLPRYASDLYLVRGRCLKRTTRTACPSRYGLTRVTVDYTSAAAVEKIAVVECVLCGHVWYRVKVPAFGPYQSVALTLVVPSEQRRWYSRGKWHVQGQESIAIRNASWSDLMTAAEEWRDRNGKLLAARARQKARKAELEAAALAAWKVTEAKIAAREAEREAEETAAAEREAGR